MEIYINPSKDEWPAILARPESDFSGLRDDMSPYPGKGKEGG